MSPEHLANLPPWLQVTISVVVFAGCFWIYMSGLFKNLPQPPVPSSAKAKSDVVVPSMTFTDGKVIEGWIDEIRRGNRIDEERSDLAEQQLRAIERLERAAERIERRFEDLTRVLESLLQVMRRKRPPVDE